MKIERKALYNLMRMNWQIDPNINVEPWQIEDYRLVPIEKLFALLGQFSINLDRTSFIAFANLNDTPEDFANSLLHDDDVPASTQDQIYLIVFELWRRLVPERPGLSILCDELDYQINLYDQGLLKTPESLQDVLANLQAVLDENVDQGLDPQEVFKSISEGCAHDTETFLYDFIAEQIDQGNYPYAGELLEGFFQYLSDIKWFKFLQARVTAHSDLIETNRLLKEIIDEYSFENDLEFNLELLAFIAREGMRELFVSLVKQTLPLLKFEEDFQDLLATCADYYHYLDEDAEETMIKSLLSQRFKIPPEVILKANNPDYSGLLRILMNSVSPQKIKKPTDTKT